MKTVFRTLAILLCAGLVWAAPALADYSRIVEDLPLMPGMTEQAEAVVVFDTPQGRIVQTVAITPHRAEDVMSFYTDALTPLGWTPTAPSIWQRADEQLEISFEEKEGVLNVHFELSPVP